MIAWLWRADWGGVGVPGLVADGEAIRVDVGLWITADGVGLALGVWGVDVAGSVWVAAGKVSAG
jgi:hypothetical protein